MVNLMSQIGNDISSYHALREKQHEQVVRWAYDFINGSGTSLYRKTLRAFLRQNPSGLEKLPLADHKRLQALLNDTDE